MTNVTQGRVAMWTRLLFSFLFVSGTLVGTSATALADFGELDITFPYVSLGDAGTPINGVNGVQHGLGDVKLSGWTFPFAKTTFSEVMVSSDGFLTLGSGKQVCGCTASLGNDTACNNGTVNVGGEQYDEYEVGYACNENPPEGAFYDENTDSYDFSPEYSPGLIAPFYNFDEEAEFETSYAIGTISYLQGGGPGTHYLIIDWNGAGNALGEYNFNTGNYVYADFGSQYQAILFEGGAIVFTYGTQAPLLYQSNGFEIEDFLEWMAGAYFPPPDGGMGITSAGSMLGPSMLYQTNNCMWEWEQYGDDCESEDGFNDWTELSPAYMGDLNTPFLVSAPTASGVAGPNGPVIDVSVTVTNNGTSAQAEGFPIQFALVKAGEPPYGLPTTCAGSSTCLSQTPFPFTKAIPAGQSVSLTVSNGYSLPTPLPPSGLYNVASIIDPANTTVNSTAPLLEIGISKKTLALGQDMTGQIQVTDFAPVQPGEFIVPLTFTNLGLEEAISVPYELDFIAADGTPSPGGHGTIYGLAGLANEVVNQDVTIPSNLQPGQYQLELIIDAGLPVDLNPANNIILGVQHVENGQDMTASILSVPFSVASPVTAPTDFTVPVVFHNLGLQPANGIPWTLFLTGADGNPFPVGTGIITSLPGLSSSTQGLNAVIKTALPSGAYTLSLQIGPTSQGVSPLTPDLNLSNNTVFDTTPVYVYTSSSDYAVGTGDLSLPGASHIADGQIIGVTRTIHNLEGPAGPCPYGYFLNPPGVTQVGDGVPVAILSPTGPTFVGTTPSFGPYGQANANNTATDQIVIPAGMPVGPYNLVLALNPQNQIDDINPGNNDVAIPVSVGSNPLQITSPSSLPAAIVGTPYVYTLQETGASGGLAWSILAGSLPSGMALNVTTGEISGSPTVAAVYTLVIQLTAQGGTQVAVLQLPVAAGSGALQVEQSGASLPTAIVMSPYLQQLQAQGGVPPYTWKGTIPSSLYSLQISTAGVLGGIPQEATDGPIQFTVVVTDAIGTTASQTLTLQVIAPGDLTITTPFLQPAVVGIQYDQPILASDGTVTGATFSWSLSAQSTLPAGIQFQEIGTPAVADLSGVPTQAGIFPVVVNLADNFGHSASRQYILTVAESPIPVPKQTLPVAIIGNSYAAQLQAASVSTLSWRLFSGQLPPGLSLLPTGAISGTVPSDTVPGVYPFAAAVSNGSGAESVVPLEIRVQAATAAGGGCATGTGPVGAGLLLLAMIWLSRRRRRLQGSALAAAGILLLAAPAAFSQVPAKPCGTPPAPIQGTLPFQDITTALGYQALVAPALGAQDTYSDYIGGTGGGECEFFSCYSPSAENNFRAPFAVAYNLGNISLPFPFGFSGLYSDGGVNVSPFEVTVWANGLLTFDPSVSFNPFNYSLNPVPSDCEPEGESCYIDQMTGQEICLQLPSQIPSGAVSDTFGGFPFAARLSAPPNAIIAPWWGDLSLCPGQGQVGWLSTLDDNNNPMVIIQWTNATATRPEAPTPPNTCTPGDYSSCTQYLNNSYAPYPAGTLPQFSFQVRLHANNDVDFIYGASSNFNANNDCYDAAVGNCSYISGIQSNLVFPNPFEPPLLDYATQALNCDSVTGCLQSQFPAANTSITFSDVFRSLGPDLQLVSMNPPLLVPQGGTVTVPVTLSNGGGTVSSQGQIQFYFSAGGTSPEGGAFSIQNVPSYVACDTGSFQAQVTIPASAPEGGGYLVAEFVPGPESTDPRHTFASAPVIVGAPEADLAVVGSLNFTPPSVVGGQDISISFSVANVGETDAAPTAYGVYVALGGGTISASGNQIFGGVLPSLVSGAAPTPITQSIQIPLTIVSGEYLIGVIVNPGNTLKEVDLTNNVALGKKLLSVTSPGPVITTTSLVDAQANAPYAFQLVAGGGDGKYQWSLAAGALPAGLALTKTGLISGQAEAVGSGTFTVKVTDDVGHSATAVLSLNVDPFEQVLTIETVDLPAGSTGQLYNFTIAAIGGAPPYQWALVPSGGGLPSGISLISNGTLTGEPQYDGATSFQVTVTDSTGTVVTSPVYTLTVFAAGSLAVGSTQLPIATLGHTYTGVLHYAGGTAPYTWSLISINREPGFPGDPGQNLGANIQNIGLGFYPLQGQLEGVPNEVGVFALQVQVTDSETPPASAQGLVLLTVSATTSFSFETVLLPPATVNQYYSTTIQTNAPANDMVTCHVINTAQLITDTAGETLPPGITLYSNCTLQGVPLLAGNYSFLVEATDSFGGVAEQSFSIQVSIAKAGSSGGGCQSAPGAPALAGLLLLALTQVRRRSFRRRARG